MIRIIVRKYDNKVPYNFAKKQNRPFVGVLFNIGKIKYFAPLSSPKPKHLKMHNNIDFLKIDKGNLGAINFNNMIPVLNNNITLLNLESKYLSEEEYKLLLKKQIRWLNRHNYQVFNKSKHLYNMYNNNHLDKKLLKDVVILNY